MRNYKGIKVRNSKYPLFALIATLVSVSVYASPTYNESVPCKNQAILLLEYCLNKNNFNNPENMSCWTESRARYESCRVGVIESHNPEVGRARAEAKKRLIEELRRKNKAQ